MYKKLLISFFLVSLVSVSFLKPIDKLSSEQLDAAFIRSVSVFAIARSLNGLISVLQGTEVLLSPAGVGVNLALGQIVDPMNDMVERFSWIMLMSSVSLGVQEIMLHFGQTQLVQVLLALSVLVLIVILWIPKLWHKESFNLIFKGFVIFSFLRFMVPLVVLINENIYSYGLQQQYVSAKTSLEVTESQTEEIVQKLRNSQYKNDVSFWNLGQKVDSFKLKMQVLWINLKNKFNHAISYMLTLMTIFIVQSILLPLASLWLFMKLFKNFMRTDMSKLIVNAKD